MGSGLFPLFGVHHRNRANCFALADDIMEPYRPFVDGLVWEIVHHETPPNSLHPHHKRRLLEVLTLDTLVGSERSPLQIALSTTAASLAQCYSRKRNRLVFPLMPS